MLITTIVIAVSTPIYVILYHSDLILAIAFTRPLWATLTDGIIGRIGDNIYFIWLVGWFKKAYFSLGVNPMNVWFLNYPAGWSLASTEIAPAQLAIAVPFALPGGETFGYNAALLISFALSGWICTFNSSCYFKGSYPPGFHGWHLKRRLMPR